MHELQVQQLQMQLQVRFWSGYNGFFEKWVTFRLLVGYYSIPLLVGLLVG